MDLTLNDYQMNYVNLENNRIKPVDWTLEAKRKIRTYYFIERMAVLLWLRKK